MNAHTAWLRGSVLAIALVLLVAGTGCGGSGGGDYYAPVGTLEITNDAFSTDVVDTVEIQEFGSPTFSSFFVDLFPGEFVDFDLYPASYDVTIYWNSGAVEFHAVDVFDGFTTFLTVSN